MSEDRMSDILGSVYEPGGGFSSRRLCEAGRSLVGASGAGLMLSLGGVNQGSLGWTDTVSRLIEDLQYTLGEGPCMDAYRADQVVSEPDLAGAGGGQWSAFTPPVVAAGARAVFAFPLRVGQIRLGVMDLYQDRPGDLEPRQLSDALAFADLAASFVLDLQAGAGPGTMATELDQADFHFLVHNAAGMASVQLGMSVADALVRLRAYAFRQDQSLLHVAEDVVERRLRFGEDGAIDTGN